MQGKEGLLCTLCRALQGCRGTAQFSHAEFPFVSMKHCALLPWQDTAVWRSGHESSLAPAPCVRSQPPGIPGGAGACLSLVMLGAGEGEILAAAW
jgi:hypothetical protein